MLASSTCSHKDTSIPHTLYSTSAMKIADHRSAYGGFDNVSVGLQNSAFASHTSSSLTPSTMFNPLSDRIRHHQSDSAATFDMSYSSFDEDDIPIIIDTFSPKRQAFDLSIFSPCKSSPYSNIPRSPFPRLIATHSRVIRMYNLPTPPQPFLSTVFQSRGSSGLPVPESMWTSREGYRGQPPSSIWAVFRTPEEASTALALLRLSVSVEAAAESELEAFHKLRPFLLNATAPNLPTSEKRMFRACSDSSKLVSPPSGLDTGDYTISSNPPNPRLNFRFGDWICSLPNCAAHNFGRNLSCIGCGCPRSGNGSVSAQNSQSQQPVRTVSSPRFASVPATNVTPPPPSPAYAYSQQAALLAVQSKNAHPLLTPSGRAFAVGGSVRNISTDPSSPCIMYWPDNEPLPEQGQIRPGNLAGVPQPPILNTGNRGPISHQPGDWICTKCNYLNWRRRKVCQTCLPYAEGNGDSISAAVQAERIALLTSVLSQAQAPAQTDVQSPANVQRQDPNVAQVPSGMQLGSQEHVSREHRSHSLSPSQQKHPFVEPAPLRAPITIHRPQPQYDIQYADKPIYQTSGHRTPSPLYSTGPDVHHPPSLQAPAPLLPSFLQDIIQSPTLSPTSSSSADLSLEEYDEPSTKATSFPRTHSGDDSVTGSPIGNIWRLDGEESKSLSAFALPNQQDLLGEGRKNEGRKNLPRF